ncbi:MAG: PAS domain-containing sensor histidine kinase [Bacteroidetes bacterium]|nr:PAS domain-containing sensor histidine kinase [Bacteroidota bacterium]
MTTDDSKLRSVFFDYAAVPFFLYDKDFYLIDINNDGLELLQTSREQIIGKHITEVSPDIKTSQRYILYKEVIRTGKSIAVDEAIQNPGFGTLFFRIKAFKVNGGLGVTVKNITDLRNAIDELKTLIYKLSHNIRTPIANILGLFNILDKEVKDLDTAFHFFKIIKERTEFLDTIVLRLVETMSVRDGHLNIEEIDFNKTINKVLQTVSHMKGFDKIKFETIVNVKQIFYSDSLLLNFLFQNIIENGIKYKKENTNEAFIKISVTDEPTGIKIIIADNGIGITDNLQKDIFKMFFRATDKATGQGIGLYTVKQSIKKLGGYIVLDSKADIGTTFTIYVPNAKEDE